MISLMWAMDKNWLIGKDGRLPWRLPADLAYAKALTIGHKLIMGRKTYESIGKPLPGRETIIVTRNRNYHADGCTILNSIEEALAYSQNEEVFVWGGADIYELFLPYADKLYVTLVEDKFEGDTYFPKFDFENWTLASKAEGDRNDKNPYLYYFMVYERK